MSYGLFLSAAGMQANEYRMNIVANNLANTQTTGFKHDLAVFSQKNIAARIGSNMIKMSHPVFDGMTGGADISPTYHAFTQGTLEQTGRPFDVAVEGDGFFKVQDGDEIRYTRDGRMTFNSKGELVLIAGGGQLKVLSDEGNPIVRLADSGDKVRIDTGGAVLQGVESLGRIALIGFDQMEKVRKVGRNLFDAGDASTRKGTGIIIPNTLENSTFDPMAGLITLIEVQRAYEMNARMLSLQDQVTGMATNTVGRLG